MLGAWEARPESGARLRVQLLQRLSGIGIEQPDCGGETLLVCSRAGAAMAAVTEIDEMPQGCAVVRTLHRPRRIRRSLLRRPATEMQVCLEGNHCSAQDAIPGTS